jgi:steroid delta-isomerase-like uncharacterized protein
MTEQNANVVRRLIEDVWNKRNIEVVETLLTPDTRIYDPNTPEVGSGPEAYRKVFALYTNAFPDVRLTINDLIDGGDKVVVRWNAKGTHSGNLGDIAPTNRQLDITGTTTFRVTNGKIAEQWLNWDALGMLQQLGVVPKTQTPAKAA